VLVFLIYSHVCHDSFTRVPWLIYTCAMTRSHVRHDSFTRVLWLIHTCSFCVCQDSSALMPMFSVLVRDFSSSIHVCAMTRLRVPWLLHMCVMTHSHVCHDSFTCVPWLIYVCAMTHSRVYHDSSTCVPWLLHMGAMTHSHVCHSYFIRVGYHFYRAHSCEVVIKHMWMSHGTRAKEPWHTCDWVMAHVYRNTFKEHCKRGKVTFCIGVCNMIHTRMCVRHDSYMTHLYLWHDPFICATWLIHMCDMTHSYVRHDSFISVRGVLHMCDLTREYV